MYRTIMGAAGLVALAACGGSGGGSVMTDAERAEAIIDRGDALVAQYDDLLVRGAYTPTDNLPATGRATYTGAAAYVQNVNRALGGQEIYDRAEIVSNVTLNVRFGSESIEGTLSDFYTIDGEAIAGRVDIDASLDRGADPDTAFQISGTLDGDVTDADGIDSRIAGAITADFYGNDARMVSGFLDGVATSSEGTSGLQGAFVAD